MPSDTDCGSASERHDATLRDALRVYGIEAQLCMAQEECAELIVAVSHLRRGRADIDKVAEEIADVQLVLRQIELHIGGRVAEHRQMKLARLKVRLEETDEDS